MGLTSTGEPRYALSFLLLVPVHLAATLFFLKLAVKEVDELRRLADKRPSTVSVVRAIHFRESYIHPLALPIKGNALFWKECLKDGSYWSLSTKWLGPAVLAVAALCLICHPFTTRQEMLGGFVEIRGFMVFCSVLLISLSWVYT